MFPICKNRKTLAAFREQNITFSDGNTKKHFISIIYALTFVSSNFINDFEECYSTLINKYNKNDNVKQFNNIIIQNKHIPPSMKTIERIYDSLIDTLYGDFIFIYIQLIDMILIQCISKEYNIATNLDTSIDDFLKLHKLIA